MAYKQDRKDEFPPCNKKYQHCFVFYVFYFYFIFSFQLTTLIQIRGWSERKHQSATDFA